MFVKNIFVKVLYLLIVLYLVLFIPSIFGYKPLVVVSGSMEPTLKVGSIVYYQEISKDKLNVGDILVFRKNNHIVSHRIVEIYSDSFSTKGDANDSLDQNKIEYSDVLGRAFNFCIPLLGYYADFIYNHKFILVIIIFLILIDTLIDIYKKDNEDET